MCSRKSGLTWTSRLKPTDVNNVSKTMQEMRVSLRGKLATDYIRLRNNNPEAASKWVRKVCKDAVNGHPQLAYKMVPDLREPTGKRFMVGMVKEIGTMGDW